MTNDFGFHFINTDIMLVRNRRELSWRFFIKLISQIKRPHPHPLSLLRRGVFICHLNNMFVIVKCSFVTKNKDNRCNILTETFQK